MEGKTHRNSKQRQLVLEAVQSMHNHPTAEEIYQIVRQKNPNISLGTVYRNLHLLTEMGQIQKLDLGSDSFHFDGICKEHTHFICEECGQIEDFYTPLSADIRNMLEQEMARPIHRVCIHAFGVCAECQKKCR